MRLATDFSSHDGKFEPAAILEIESDQKNNIYPPT